MRTENAIRFALLRRLERFNSRLRAKIARIEHRMRSPAFRPVDIEPLRLILAKNVRIAALVRDHGRIEEAIQLNAECIGHYREFHRKPR